VDQLVIGVGHWVSNTDIGLYVVDPATGESRRLTTPPQTAWDDQPHISADGKRVVYVRHDGTADPNSSIRIVNADGTDEPGILSRGIHPRWSPDGSRIAFSLGVDGALPDIHVIRPDSGGLENLTRQPDAPDMTLDSGGDSAPRWSPDGNRIAFNSESHTYLVDSDA
jgi:Tol biopolymer transport system component